jgi:CRP-like cAMP-binding protein
MMSATQHPLQLLVRKLELSSFLDEEARAAILALPFTLRTLEPSTYILREGDEPAVCSVLVSGFAYRQKTTYVGARQIVSLHIPGEALDFQNLYLDVADHSLQMLTRGEVASIKRADVQALLENNVHVARAVLVHMLIEASIFREWILNVGRRDAQTGLAHFLCEFGVRMDAMGLASEYGYALPMTQEQLGDTLGLTPVHVNRTLKALEARGLIQRNGRDVSFPEWQVMRGASDFNQRYLHLAPQRATQPRA